MESFDGIDMDAAGRVAGNGFYYLLGNIARLHEAVLAYARDFMINKGFTYVIPPFMMHGNVVQGVMSFPEMDAMMYKIEGEDLYERGRPPWQDGICPKLNGFGSPWTGRGLDAARHETHTLRDLALVAAHVGCGRRGPRASACKGSLASLVRERTRNEDH